MKIAFILGLSFMIVGLVCYILAYVVEKIYKKKMNNISKNK